MSDISLREWPYCAFLIQISRSSMSKSRKSVKQLRRMTVPRQQRTGSLILAYAKDCASLSALLGISDGQRLTRMSTGSITSGSRSKQQRSWKLARLSRKERQHKHV